jgi:hypothetical protein
VKERLLEFGGEGVRKYDLIRWNLIANKIAETKTKLLQFVVGAPTDGNPYANGPDYIYAAATTFNNGSDASEVASLSLYGGSPMSVFYKLNTLKVIPQKYPNRIYWRRDVGYYDKTGKLVSSIITDTANYAYASRFVPNFKELLPYPASFLSENRGGVTQNPHY